MKNLKTIFYSLLLVIALTGTASAGHMNTPYAPSDSPTEVESDSSTLVQVTSQILINSLLLVF